MFVRAKPCKDFLKASGASYSNEAEFNAALASAVGGVNQTLTQKCPTFMPEYTAAVKSGDFSSLSAGAEQCAHNSVPAWKDFKRCISCGNKAAGKCANSPTAHCLYEQCGNKSVQFTPLYWAAVALAAVLVLALVLYVARRNKH